MKNNSLPYENKHTRRDIFRDAALLGTAFTVSAISPENLQAAEKPQAPAVHSDKNTEST